jgi:hypothetical protein
MLAYRRLIAIRRLKNKTNNHDKINETTKALNNISNIIMWN